MRFAIAAVAIALFLAPAAASALECNDSSTQSDLNTCADQDLKAADAKLNATYKEIIGRLSDNAPAAQALVEAERNWIAFRDAECRFQAVNSVDGSIYPLLILDCSRTLTESRIEELEAYLACDEGDTLCPVPAAE